METTTNGGTMSTAPIYVSSPELRKLSYAAHDRWTQTLLAQARDDSDPETQANARLLLDNRGIAW
jgi:hypothetical protein